ncbi:hypothetical protein Y1Q_0019039 [Alligator mississippiensis]|uniref:Uncharacterized protein n=1 Tax=Alligator mississippiensis TaxID=8496 RepID=A0A151NNV8_ALLMI|nr:hypothetical protein Y1Q_0019039 [Alligator mississippiensis]
MDCLEILDQRVKLGILAFQGKLDQRETEENWVFQVLSVKRVMKETRDLPDTGVLSDKKARLHFPHVNSLNMCAKIALVGVVSTVND